MLPSPFNPQTLRDDLPRYPPLLQLLRVTPATVTGPSGVAQVAGSSVLGPTLYVAFVQQLRTDGLIPRDREPCLADDVNDVIKGNPGFPGFYLGRLAGSYTSLPVYEIVAVTSTAAATSSGTGVSFAKCLTASPTSGRYDARLQVLNADGTLADTGASIWLRDGNDTPALLNGEIYLCSKTGTTAGRDVYTTCDFNLTVRDQDLSQSQSRTLYAEFGPANTWTITSPASRRTLVKRVLEIYESGSLRMDFVKKITFEDVDFDLTAGAAGSGNIDNIQTNGVTGAFYLLSSCTAGVLKKRLLTFTRGLLKSIDAEVDA